MNRQWIYATHPDGPVGADNFEYRESPIPEPGAGQALARMCYLSFEPAMRTWLEDFITYMPPVPLGDPMLGPGVAQVVKSNTPALNEGDLDGAIDYKNEDLGARLAELCPDSVDVYFDNVGGAMLETVMGHMAQGGRIACCGAISTYDQGLRRPGPSNMFQIIEKRLAIKGFVMFDHMDQVPKASADLSQWVADGEIAFRADIQEGFENIPTTFLRLFSGANQGKQLLKVRDPE